MSITSQQPPLVAYPNTFANNPPPPTITTPTSSNSNSNGSFGTVFIVLAVIVVVSGIACCLGRICNKNKNKNKQKPNKHSLGPSPRPTKEKGGKKERESDVEFGFEKGFPTVRSGPIRNGDPRGFKPPPGNGHHFNGGGDHFKGESFNPVEMMGPKGGPM